MPANRMLTIMMVLSGIAAPLPAQITVFFDHRPDATVVAQRLLYRGPNDMEKDRRPWVEGRRFEVPSGQRVCFVIVSSNPVFYTYAVGSRVIEVPRPSEVQGLISALQTALKRGLAARDASRTARYLEAVVALRDEVTRTEAARSASDASTSFTAAYDAVLAAFAGARTANDAADALYEALQAGAKDTLPRWGSLAIELFRSHQQSLYARATAIRQEFAQAAQHLEEPMCVPVDRDRMKVFLSITKRESAAARVSGDTLVSFEVEPTESANFAVIPGVVVSAFAQDQRAFFLNDGVVTSEADNQPRVKPALLMVGRAWSSTWLWGGLGAALDGDGLADLFAGPVARFGDSIVGTQINVGLGPTLSWVPVRLKEGQVGSPLPPGKRSVDELVKREMRMAFGIVFSLSGFNLGGT